MSFKTRFGTLAGRETRISAKGDSYLKVRIGTPRFTIHAVAFDTAIISEIQAASIGDRIWVMGPVNVKSVSGEDGSSKTYSNLVIHKVRITEAADEVMEELEADDLTAIKGIGAAVAERLNALGFLTYAQLAEADARTIAVLDDEVPAISGALTRADVFGQARRLAGMDQRAA